MENGRIKDAGDYRLKTGLRRVAEQFKPDLRLTPSQNILLVNVKPEDRDGITETLAEHGVPVENQASVIRRASIACPALPTCGLALAESERVMPDVLTRIEALLAEVGLQDEEIIIRMTGCPNGCARPYTAELALVGKAPGKYQLYVGGNEPGTRLGSLYKESVKVGRPRQRTCARCSAASPANASARNGLAIFASASCCRKSRTRRPTAQVAAMSA